MKHLVLIISKGCVGCDVVKYALESVFGNNSDVFEIIDQEHVDKEYLKLWDVEDFPALVLLDESDERLDTVTGSFSISWLKNFAEKHHLI